MLKNKKRDDGRVQAKVYLGDDRYKYVYAKNNRELEQKVTELKIKLGKGIDLTADRDTFGYWLEKWLKIKKASVSANWYTHLEQNANKLDDIYNIPVSKLRMFDLQDILYSLENPNDENGAYSQRVLKAVKDIASGVVQLAIENRVVDYNMFEHVTLPKTKPKYERRALTEEEQMWIRETPHRAQTAAMIMMYAGLRRGELIPLLWSDIDLANKTISVTKSVEMLDGKPNVKKGGKTYSATRTVYIPQILADYLSAQPRTSFLVCTNAKGGMMSDSAWRRLWDSYMSVLNYEYGNFKGCIELKGERPDSRFAPVKLPMVIPPFTAHWLRHTFVTLMYFAGVDILTAKEQAGHSDVKTTLSIYTHLDKKFKKFDINKMDVYLNGCQMGVKSE